VLDGLEKHEPRLGTTACISLCGFCVSQSGTVTVTGRGWGVDQADKTAAMVSSSHSNRVSRWLSQVQGMGCLGCWEGAWGPSAKGTWGGAQGNPSPTWGP
jgi:hypothetical protein